MSLLPTATEKVKILAVASWSVTTYLPESLRKFSKRQKLGFLLVAGKDRAAIQLEHLTVSGNSVPAPVGGSIHSGFTGPAPKQTLLRMLTLKGVAQRGPPDTTA